ncbi:NEAT domain-containing protein [Sporosarcina sp. CAU 1771]
MKRILFLPFLVSAFLFGLAIDSMEEVRAANLTDGTYQIDFEVLQPETNSVSIANDYFEKPAILTLDNGEYFVQYTVNHSKWVKVLQSPNGDLFEDMHVISEDLENDYRVVAFKVDGNISDPVMLKMHVVIEDMVPAYDHKYSVRMAFDVDSVEETDEPAVVLTTSESEKGSKQKLFIYVLIGVTVLIVLLGARKLSSAKRKK